jgi:cytochrome c biogenesis factor
VLFGTALPLLAGGRIAVDPHYFSVFTAPAAAVAGVLAVAALTRRNRAMVVAHLGFVVLLVGIAGTTFGTTRTLALAPGQTQHGLTNRGWSARTQGDRTSLTVDLGHGLRPGLATYAGVPEALPVVAHRGDTTVVLRRLDRDSGHAVVDVFTRPLASLVWLGALLLALAGALALKQSAQAGVGRGHRLGDPDGGGLVDRPAALVH